MTRQEWINRYVAAMLAGGSELPEWRLRLRAEQDCDATEQTGWADPNDWESPEVVAEEHLESE
ncbi:hypothetical protein [Acidovorax carolinensis]|uniref:hypothetical protein n=1 Tax=Acidovorax carolinensis TaxID=553814 RepID=UPI0012FFB2A9|nr:hypothetical protein [Acidovorax carolinensis]